MADYVTLDNVITKKVSSSSRASSVLSDQYIFITLYLNRTKNQEGGFNEHPPFLVLHWGYDLACTS